MDIATVLTGGAIGAIFGFFIIREFFKGVSGNAVFWGAILGEMAVLLIFYLTTIGVLDIAYLWLNLIGCILVILFALILEQFWSHPKVKSRIKS